MNEDTKSTVNPRYFLQKKLHFYLTLAVIATTLFSWFNINSYLIILLLLCRLLDGNPRMALRTAFANHTFLAYLSIFLLEVAGLFYTHQLFVGWHQMESKATLFAIPFIICAGPFTDDAGYRRLLSAYCLLLSGICLYCLSMAVVEYHWQHDLNVFFYHQLTSAVSVNAVFFSGYVLVAIIFLLFSSGPATSSGRAISPGPAIVRRLRIALIVFFTIMMVLLSSRLLLVLLAVIFGVWLIGLRRSKMNSNQVVAFGLLIFLGMGLLAFTDNPLSRRCKELQPVQGAFDLKKNSISTTDLNGVTFRLLLWRFAFEILNERQAWVFGVSAGDSQELLDQKYMDSGMSEGFLGYNFHNEFVEVLVRSGIVGCGIFMLAVLTLIRRARSAATPEVSFTIAVVLLLFLTESTLEMQHTLFLSSFFPLLALSRRAAP
jgi:O-antigen ligase